MSWTVIIALILIGLIFLVLEILVIPGTTVIGIMGFVLIVIGIWQAYATHGTAAGHYTVAATALLSVGSLVLSFRYKTWRKLMLDAELDGKVNIVEPDKIKVGDIGKTVTRLNPMGKALINGEFYEVKSGSGFVDENVDIYVTKIVNSQIIVKIKE